MKEIYDLFKKASPLLLCLAALAYFVKVGLENKIAGIESRITEVAHSSLEIKKELRTEERACLVDFRVALLKWEDSLLTGLTDYANQPPSEAQAQTIYENDKKLFLEVETGAIRASIYLRDPKLEDRLLSSILQIRRLYYPLIYQTLPQLIDLQTQLIPIENKMKKFADSGMKDMAFAPTQQDLETSRRIQAAMTEQMRGFSEAVKTQYRPIAEQLVSLKEEINRYIYRPIASTAVDRD